MKYIELYFLAFLILIASITLLIGAFSPCWITGSFEYLTDHGCCQGPVFYTDEGYWLVLTMWFMIDSIVLFGIICWSFYRARYEILKNGYCRKNGSWFKGISIASAVSVLFICAAVTVTGTHLNAVREQVNTSDETGKMGYSVWISVGSAGVAVGVSLMSAYILFTKCHDPISTQPVFVSS
uniref:G_PROTEIN_RECEP_F1_2 domain-containing protein n=1 Tax=Caenorhabditis tropicalis TaxID=1561998 RepID=A0A1I7U9L4_9PELO